MIEPFSVPPDMAAEGLTGEVVASQMLDKLAVMGGQRILARRRSPMPTTGATTSRWRFPRPAFPSASCSNSCANWLGHDIHITGEVYRTAAGIAVTARTGGEAGATFTGAGKRSRRADAEERPSMSMNHPALSLCQLSGPRLCRARHRRPCRTGLCDLSQADRTGSSAVEQGLGVEWHRARLKTG